MKVYLRPPSRSEATVEITQENDTVISPRFFKSVSQIPIVYLVVVDPLGVEENYVLRMNARTKRLNLTSMREVPSVQEEPKDEPPVQDQDVCRTIDGES